MRQLLTTVALMVALATPAAAEEAGMAKIGDITVHDAWARASLGNLPTSAAYLTIETEGAGDRLLAAASPAAEKAALHTHLMEGDIAKMRPVDAIEVAPGAPTILQPGGLHIMLTGLTEKLEEGGRLPLTLTFETAGEVALELPVRAATSGMGDGHGGHGS